MPSLENSFPRKGDNRSRLRDLRGTSFFLFFPFLSSYAFYLPCRFSLSRPWRLPSTSRQAYAILWRYSARFAKVRAVPASTRILSKASRSSMELHVIVIVRVVVPRGPP